MPADSSADWDREFVEAAGLRLRVGRHGPGRPLLLITGIGAHLDMWAPFARHAGERELIAFDAPGAGLSQRTAPAPADGRACPRRARAAGRAAARARRRARLLVRRRARPGARPPRAPERVRRLVLCATGPGLGGIPPRPMAALMLATPARYYHPRLLALTLPAHRGRAHGARSVPCSRSTPASGCGGRRTCSATPTSSTRRRAGRACRGCTASAQPTLVVAGDDDPSVPLRNAPPARRAPARRARARRQGRRAPVPARRARAARSPRSGSSWTRRCDRLTTTGGTSIPETRMHARGIGAG